ncbi:hypothetical protein AKJ39_02125 [candidate division MSBL1 archaeon SCGC-AAA259J03]|uniref:Uncharacterized protein n=1 Tax=candidate division MSBL1 archaeon SCGC-AAA259J03 TaxID=1698269 RepID=A0A656YZM1_9EURY|nr:hypothetical protein AKJ39_02125 [candidate division MSBL1 archaeon SCGC-AAA259J03]
MRVSFYRENSLIGVTFSGFWIRLGDFDCEELVSVVWVVVIVLAEEEFFLCVLGSECLFVLVILLVRGCGRCILRRFPGTVYTISGKDAAVVFSTYGGFY